MRHGATSQERWPSLENYLPQSTLNAESIERSQHAFKVGLGEFAFGALRLEVCTFARLDRDLHESRPWNHVLQITFADVFRGRIRT